MAQIVELLLGTLDKVTITRRPCYLSYSHFTITSFIVLDRWPDKQLLESSPHYFDRIPKTYSGYPKVH